MVSARLDWARALERDGAARLREPDLPVTAARRPLRASAALFDPAVLDRPGGVVRWRDSTTRPDAFARMSERRVAALESLLRP